MPNRVEREEVVMPVLAEGGEEGGEGPFSTTANKCDLLAYSRFIELIFLLAFRKFHRFSISVLSKKGLSVAPLPRKAHRGNTTRHGRHSNSLILRSPIFDSKESTPPGYVFCSLACGARDLFVLGS